MKLPLYTQSLEEKMSEFDLWVTPSLGNIRDTEQFQFFLNRLLYGFDLLAIITKSFATPDTCKPSSMASGTIQLLNDAPASDRQPMLDAICGVLLLATGKTDNNLKCQYPLLLFNAHHITHYPQPDKKGQWKDTPIPRTFGLEAVTRAITQMHDHKKAQRFFTETYFRLILSDDDYIMQLWNLGSQHCRAKMQNQAALALAPIVTFQARGSITATQGHIPEQLLRNLLTEWGLLADEDFNTQDVEVGLLLQDSFADSRVKKRKYDFILPFQSRSTGQKIFIQSQFYAGDSGSVSHKVVDQTDSTREATLQKYPDAVFLEYLDGAGYFASLNGDLRKMLAKPTTKDFFQIRTAPIKLRRELQTIRYLTLLEVEHAILRTEGTLSQVIQFLHKENYSMEEISYVIKYSLERGILQQKGDVLFIHPERAAIVRRYCLLDTIAAYGSVLSDPYEKEYLMIPGYQTSFGIPYGYLNYSAHKLFPRLRFLQTEDESLIDDLTYLLEKGFLIKTGRTI